MSEEAEKMAAKLEAGWLSRTALSRADLGKEAASLIRSQAERIRVLEAALEQADRGLSAGIGQCASRAIGGSIVAQDEQYPWVAEMMRAQYVARAAMEPRNG